MLNYKDQSYIIVEMYRENKKTNGRRPTGHAGEWPYILISCFPCSNVQPDMPANGHNNNVDIICKRAILWHVPTFLLLLLLVRMFDIPHDSSSSLSPGSSSLPGSPSSPNPSAPLVRSYFSSTSAKRSPSKLFVPYWLGAIPSLRTIAG